MLNGLIAIALPLSFLLPQGEPSLPVDLDLSQRASEVQALIAELQATQPPLNPQAQTQLKSLVDGLRQLSQAKPSSLISINDSALYLGASSFGQHKFGELKSALSHFSPDALLPHLESTSYEEARAQDALQKALSPISLHDLARIAQLFPHTQAGIQAAQAWRYLALDQGSLEAGPAPIAWQKNWKPRLSSAFHRLPFAANSHFKELPILSFSDLEKAWEFSFHFPWRRQNYRHKALVADGRIYACNGREVAALSLATGKKIWHFQGPQSWSQFPDFDPTPLESSTDPDFLHSAVLSDGILLALVQEAVNVGRKDNFRDVIAVRRSLPGRRLYAFDANTGRLLWKQKVHWWDDANAKPVSEQAVDLVAGPPAVLHGRIYLPTYDAQGTLDLSLQALDLYTGERLWKRFLASGAQQTNLFGNILHELACPPPVAAEGKVWVASGLGALSCLDAITGSVEWTRTYPRTEVQSFQSGRDAFRPATFRLEPLIYDKNHLILTPHDGPTAFSVHPQSGELQKEWDCRETTHRKRQVLGASSHGLWFMGTHAGLAPFPGQGGSGWLSPTLFSTQWRHSLLQGGALTRQALISTSSDGLSSFHLKTGKSGKRLFESLQQHPFLDIQTSDGHLFVVHPKGVQVWRSPQSILSSLKELKFESPRAAHVVGTLADFDYSQASSSWTRAVHQGINRYSPEQIGDLPILTQWNFWKAQGKISAFNRDKDSANIAFEQILKLDLSPAQKEESALAILNALMDFETKLSSFESALAYLEEASTHLAITWKGRAKQALQRHQSEVARTYLSRLLLDESEAAKVHYAWASNQLRKLLQANFQVRSAHDKEAKQLLSSHGLTAPILRAFGETHCVKSQLESELDRLFQSGSLHAFETVRSIRELAPSLWTQWVRNFGINRTLESLLQNHTAPVPADITLETSASWVLDTQDVLALRFHEGAPHVLLENQSGALWHKVVVTPTQAKLQALPSALTYPNEARSTRLPLQTLNGQLFLSENTLIHYAFDGSTTTTRLEHPLHLGTQAHSFGTLFSIFTIDDGQLFLEIRELATGALWMKRATPSRPEHFLRIVSHGRFLYLLESRTPSVQRFDLLGLLPDSTWNLPFAPTASQLLKVAPHNDGLLMSREQKVYFISERSPQIFPHVGYIELVPFSAQGGAGWLQQPLIPGGDSPSHPTLSWLGGSSSRPLQTSVSEASTFFPQLRYSHSRPNRDLGKHLFAFLPDKNKQAKIHCHGFDKRGISLLSRIPLPGIPFSSLAPAQPQPLPLGKERYLIPIVQSTEHGRSSQLHLFLLDTQSGLARQWQSPTRQPRSVQRLFAATKNQLLVLEGEKLYLLK